MSNEAWLWWLGSISVAVFILSLATLPWVVSRIPEDYFCHRRRMPADWKQQHPIIRFLLLTGKNLLGLALFIGGIIMLVIPGQGILTIVMGIVLMDYPGKYQLERRIVSIHIVHSGLNWLRRKNNAPPLILE